MNKPDLANIREQLKEQKLLNLKLRETALTRFTPYELIKLYIPEICTVNMYPPFENSHRLHFQDGWSALAAFIYLSKPAYRRCIFKGE